MLVGRTKEEDVPPSNIMSTCSCLERRNAPPPALRPHICTNSFPHLLPGLEVLGLVENEERTEACGVLVVRCSS
nr:unnamed protein product [Digitaria exilis]